MPPLTNAQVLEIATKAHEGQVRRNGDPYITHPIRVANHAVRLARLNRMNENGAYQVAILHDVLEDTKETRESLLEKGIHEDIVNTLYYLNKHNFSSYAAMIVHIANSKMASIVKYADLTDNLEDTDKPVGKHLLDKYELSIMLLESFWEYIGTADYIDFGEN